MLSIHSRMRLSHAGGGGASARGAEWSRGEDFKQTVLRNEKVTKLATKG